MAEVLLALGSNLGKRLANLKNALALLEEQAAILAVSPVYQTEPVGIKEQPWFVNQTARIETALAPLPLLAFLKEIERRMGRESSERNGPRIIDLDILFYENLVLKTPELTIPHPRLAERRFVLEPLSEIAGEFLHPELGLSVRELKARLAEGEWAVKLNEGE